MTLLRASSVLVGFSLCVALGGTLACGSDSTSDGGSAGAAGSSAGAPTGDAGDAGAPTGDAGAPPSTAGGSSGSGGSTGNEADLTGTMSFRNGETLTCKVTTQDFAASGEFSVICDNDEDAANYRYVQVTFKDEASARTAQTLKMMKPYAFSPEDHPDADAIAVSWTDSDGTLDSSDESTGTAKVAKNGNHYSVTLTDVSLESLPLHSTGTITAVIDF